VVEVDWVGLLVEEDAEGVWNGLFQLVSRHPAVRPMRFATDGAAVASQVEINADLTQEIFLELFQKRRFDHYIREQYSSKDIENELVRIELPNLVGARLRKRYPESFRMARRVSSLLKSSARFKRFDAEEAGSAQRRRGRPKTSASREVEPLDVEELHSHDEEDPAPSQTARRSRMVNQIYGLREWPATKPMCDSGHFSERVKAVPMRIRDTQIVGRTGSSQLIVSNPELEKLIVEVFKAIDSPADVRTIRQIVLAKIPLQDYNVASLDEEFIQNGDGTSYRREAADSRETPEDKLLRVERDKQAAKMAAEFLKSLKRAVNNNERRYSRLVSTLWYCYYDPGAPSQLQIAEKLGVSDSLVSDNRRLIEFELKKLNLTRDDGAVFSESLQRLVSSTIS
jgi:hypothetical protein